MLTAARISARSGLGRRLVGLPRISTSFPIESFLKRREEQREAPVLPKPINIVRLFSVTASNETSTRTERLRHRAGELRKDAQGKWQEFKDDPKGGVSAFGTMMRKYGPVFLGTYFGVYLVTLSTLFAGVQGGILDPVSIFQYIGTDVQSTNTVELVLDILKNYQITKPAVPFIEKYPAAANFAVAWIAVKFTEPIRLPVALALTPRVATVVGYRTEEPKTAEGVSEQTVDDERQASVTEKKDSTKF